MANSAFRNDRSATPLLLAALAVLAFAVLDAMLKGAVGRLPVFEVLFLRFGVGALYASLIFARTGQPMPGSEAFRANLVRAGAMVVSSVCLVHAFSILPLADAIVLGDSAPIFMALFGGLILGERVTGRAAAAILVGAAGVVVTLSGRLSVPHETQILASLSAVVSAAAYALSMILARRRSARDSVAFSVWAQNLFCMILVLPVAIAVWRSPATADLVWFAAIGLAAMVAHFLVLAAFARAAAARLAPIEFTGLLWAVSFGFLFFGETPGIEILLGGALIAASGLLVATHTSLPIEIPT
jgi:drug/metabolite transporter (DMT)-like permease